MGAPLRVPPLLGPPLRVPPLFGPPLRVPPLLGPPLLLPPDEPPDAPPAPPRPRELPFPWLGRPPLPAPDCPRPPLPLPPWDRPDPPLRPSAIRGPRSLVSCCRAPARPASRRCPKSSRGRARAMRTRGGPTRILAAGAPAAHQPIRTWKKATPPVRVHGGVASLRKNPAASYSPRGLPPKYHRRWQSSLPCSEWERVFPRRYNHRKPCAISMRSFGSLMAATALARGLQSEHEHEEEKTQALGRLVPVG